MNSDSLLYTLKAYKSSILIGTGLGFGFWAPTIDPKSVYKWVYKPRNVGHDYSRVASCIEVRKVQVRLSVISPVVWCIITGGLQPSRKSKHA